MYLSVLNYIVTPIHFKRRRKSPFVFLFMIGFSVDDPVASVDLFQKDHTHELVGEGHIGEA